MSAFHWAGSPKENNHSPKKDVGVTKSNTLRTLSHKGTKFARRSRDSVGSLLGFSESEGDPVEIVQGNAYRHDPPDIFTSPPKTCANRTNDGSTWHVPRNATQSSAPRSIPASSRDSLDPLAVYFQKLNADCHRFLAKSVDTRTSLVRSHVQFFLGNDVSTIPSGPLAPDVVTRRCTVLLKWWSALLDTLKAGTMGHISDADRYTIITAITGIVQRSEWKSRLTTKAEPEVIEMISKQLRYVVEQSSCRQHDNDSSFMSMSGKSIALAWFLCPGVALILSRLWELPSKSIRRLRHCTGHKSNKPGVLADGGTGIIYPASLAKLVINSTQAYSAFMHAPLDSPSKLDGVEWRNPSWLAKWRGRDTTMLFDFVQAFYVILPELILEKDSQFGCQSSQHWNIPGVIFVNAQLLQVMDSTIQNPNSSQTFDVPSRQAAMSFDHLLKIDAAAIPLPNIKMQQLVSETNLMAMFRQFLSPNGSTNTYARLLFARSFEEILKAAARAISSYDQATCFAFCDLLYEMIPTISRIYDCETTGTFLLDYGFWVEVFKRMLKSESTLIEIRLYILLFSVWPLISASQTFKQLVCNEMLLQAEFFLLRFDHWCPMVRTYFMRLLCWRVARVEEDAPGWELEILETLRLRLQMVWTRFQSLPASVSLPTQPCTPVPGRRLFIIRTDAPVTSPSSPSKALPAITESSLQSSRRASQNNDFTPDQLAERLAQTLVTSPEPVQKRRSSLLRSIMGTRSPDSGSRSGSPRRKSASPVISPQHASPRTSMNSPRTSALMSNSPETGSSGRSSLHEHRPSLGLATSPLKNSAGLAVTVGEMPAPSPISYAGTFKFSLEPIDPRRPIPPDLIPQSPRLPLATENLLHSQPELYEAQETVLRMLKTCPRMKNVGRALVEWTLTVAECQNFFERRRAEGVPSDSLVEIPVLGVETLKRPW